MRKIGLEVECFEIALAWEGWRNMSMWCSNGFIIRFPVVQKVCVCVCVFFSRMEACKFQG